MTAPSAGAQHGAVASPLVTWHVVADRSTASFTVRDKLVSTVRGTIPISAGEVVTGPDGTLVRARMELTVAGIATGNATRDGHLQNPPFLDAARHPSVVVVCGPADRTEAGWTVEAQLSARGSTCPVTLRVTPTSVDGSQVRVHVTGRLDRSGLRMPVPTLIIGRYLDLEVGALWQATDETFGPPPTDPNA